MNLSMAAPRCVSRHRHQVSRSFQGDFVKPLKRFLQHRAGQFQTLTQAFTQTCAQCVQARFSRSKATITILVDLPFNSFFKTEKSVLPSDAGTTISPSMIADEALIRKASLATVLERFVQS